jgi:hypothetical protein
MQKLENIMSVCAQTSFPGEAVEIKTSHIQHEMAFHYITILLSTLDSYWGGEGAWLGFNFGPKTMYSD